MRLGAVLLFASLAAAAAIVAVAGLRAGFDGCPSAPAGWFTVDHVADGDTVVVCGDTTVRLVQIDTPEVSFTPECFGEEASHEAKELLPRGTFVRLVPEPAGDPVDRYGRLLRYVVREDGLNVNLRLVADGAAAPYFFGGLRGVYGDTLFDAAVAARDDGKGLWGACPGTELATAEGVSTGPPLR